MKKIKNRLLKRMKQLFEYMKSDFNQSRSSNKSYPDYCLEAATNKNVFKNFRNHESYTGVLEHVNIELAKKYYYAIKSWNLEDSFIQDTCSILNEPGNPKKIKINEKVQNISSSSLRYLYTGIDIKNKLDIKNKVNIIEIGAGFGGQSIILDKIIEIDNYTFVDLSEVNMLIEKFVSNFKVNFSFNLMTLQDSFENFNEFDIVISNYAFSELPRNLQDLAINKIIKKSKSGYMIVNSDGLEDKFLMKKYNFYKINELKTIIPKLKVLEESPESHKNCKLLLFK